MPLGPALAAGAQPSAQTMPENGDLRAAARAFEAIFLRQMLAAARASSFAGQPPVEGAGLKQFQAMRDEHFAEIASGAGGLGLAEQIERQLTALVEQKRS